MDNVEIVEKTPMPNSVLARPILEWIAIAHADTKSLHKSLADELLARKEPDSIEIKETAQIKIKLCLSAGFRPTSSCGFWSVISLLKAHVTPYENRAFLRLARTQPSLPRLLAGRSHGRTIALQKVVSVRDLLSSSSPTSCKVELARSVQKLALLGQRWQHDREPMGAAWSSDAIDPQMTGPFERWLRTAFEATSSKGSFHLRRKVFTLMRDSS